MAAPNIGCSTASSATVGDLGSVAPAPSFVEGVKGDFTSSTPSPDGASPTDLRDRRASSPPAGLASSRRVVFSGEPSIPESRGVTGATDATAASMASSDADGDFAASALLMWLARDGLWAVALVVSGAGGDPGGGGGALDFTTFFRAYLQRRRPGEHGLKVGRGHVAGGQPTHNVRHEPGGGVHGIPYQCILPP